MTKRVAFICIAVLLGFTLSSVNVQAISNLPPIADAGEDQFVLVGETVILDGSNSSDPETDPEPEITYQWEQTFVDQEPAVELSGADTAFLSFIMPATLTGGTQLFFRLTVTDPEDLSSTDDVTATNAVQIDCDFADVLQRTEGVTTTIGHLTYLSIGGTPITTDLTVTDPENLDETIDVVGVLENFYWTGTQSDTVQVISRLSEANKNAINDLNLVGDERVELKLNIYEYSSFAGAYYKSFHTNNVITAGYVDGLNTVMGPGPEDDVTDPVNYSFTLEVAADDVTTHLFHRMQSTGYNSIWPWGGDETSVPDISISTGTIHFGIVKHGTSPSEVLTVENKGTSDLYIGLLGQKTPLAAPYVLSLIHI